MLVDTHSHIHFDEFKDDLPLVFKNALDNGVGHIICVGTDEVDSHRALDFVSDELVTKQASGIKLSATVGLHPHEASKGKEALEAVAFLLNLGRPVAIGECGLDYYRNLSSVEDQKSALKFQIDLALENELPLVFHVRDAWEDFFEVISLYPGLRGVVHSFTGGPSEVERAIDHGLYFGLNGIMTFTKDASQLEAAKAIPTDRLLLETDCPFLSPEPLRGRRNEPANATIIARFLADLRGEDFSDLAASTSRNAGQLFGDLK